MDIIPQTHTILYPQEPNKKQVLCFSRDIETEAINLAQKEGWKCTSRVLHGSQGAWLQFEREVKS